MNVCWLTSEASLSTVESLTYGLGAARLAFAGKTQTLGGVMCEIGIGNIA